MYQQITIVGNLGADPEMRYTPTGQAVANLSVATSRSWTDADGVRQQKTLWFRVAVWGKQAEVVSQYLSKGRQVLVTGELEEPRAFTDREGNLRASLEMRAQSVRFLGQKEDVGGGYPMPAQHSGPAESVSDEDIPF